MEIFQHRVFHIGCMLLCTWVLPVTLSAQGSQTPNLSSALSAVMVNAPKQGLRYRYYEGAWDKVSSHVGSKVLSEGIASGINLNKAKDDINYALDFEGYLLVPQTGSYEITLNCDDGGILKIDDVIEINHDGIHMAYEKSVTVVLEKGYHRLQLSYFQGEGTSELEVYWQLGKGKKVLIPKTALFYNSADK